MRFPSELVPRPSRWLSILLVGGHFLLGVTVFAAGLQPVLALILVVLAGLSLWIALRQSRCVREWTLILREDGLLSLRRNDERAFDAAPTAACVDFGWSVWLGWRAIEFVDGAPRQGIVMLPKDSLDEPQWRSLRAWMRLRAAPKARSVSA